MAGWTSTVFAHESPTRVAGFDAENRLYLFALTVPSIPLMNLRPVPASRLSTWPRAKSKQSSVLTRDNWWRIQTLGAGAKKVPNLGPGVGRFRYS
jgi:hypothetical protein